MDINKQWQQLEKAASHSSTITKDQIMKAIHKESKSTISTLRKSLKMKLNWALLFIIGFVCFGASQYDNEAVLLLMGAASLVYLLGYLYMYRQFKKMSNEIEGFTVIDTLKSNLANIQTALSGERVFGLIAFPIMIIVGLNLSRAMDGANITEIFNEIYSTKTLLIIMLVVIAGAYSAEWMNKKAFGGSIHDLKRQISDLERID